MVRTEDIEAEFEMQLMRISEPSIRMTGGLFDGHKLYAPDSWPQVNGAKGKENACR